MPDFDPPRKPRRPQHPSSDWSPRPIPQPVEPLRTADPPTPTLKELAARAQQRASVAATAPDAASNVVSHPTSSVGQPVRPIPPGPNGCAQAWAEVRAKTLTVLRSGGGDDTPRDQGGPAQSLTSAQKLTRNRAISAAYADLAEGDSRMRWAGLASVVSEQAHCAMQDAGIVRGRIRAAAAAATPVSPTVAPIAGEAGDAAAGEIEDALFDTNREIFSDIYPNVLMYKTFGMQGLKSSGEGGCGAARPDRDVAPALGTALRQIDGGDVTAGSRTIARYEQNVIVQDRIYDDPHRPGLKAIMRGTQLAANAIPTPLEDRAHDVLRIQKPEVAIATDCGAGRKVPFRGDITVAQDRVGYYDDLVKEYLKHDQSTRDALGVAVRGRDPLRGGQDYGYFGP